MYVSIFSINVHTAYFYPNIMINSTLVLYNGKPAHILF